MKSFASILRTAPKIVAVGRNYAKHAAEMGQAAPTTPLLFLKAPSSLVGPGDAVKLPHDIGEIHHEVELGEEEAAASIRGYVLAVDFTARDEQAQAKEAGLPWAVSKSHDGFCPISEMLSPEDVPDVDALELSLDVNGERRQTGSPRDMVHRIPKLLSHISHVMTLQENDLVLTGTPEGVGPVKLGDRVSCVLRDETKSGNLTTLAFTVE